MDLVLHGYWRSGTTHRTRIALNLKGAHYRLQPVNLLDGDHSADAFRRLNPQGLVPALEVDGTVLTQSPAIMEWIEETHPEPPLLPADPMARAHVRAMAALVGCDVHPLNNLRVLKAVRGLTGDGGGAVEAWIAQWTGDGFAALEQMISVHGGAFCFGDTPTLADCYLIPQVYSARRFNVPLEAYPRIVAIDARASEMDAFARAHPDRQPDAPAS